MFPTSVSRFFTVVFFASWTAFGFAVGQTSGAASATSDAENLALGKKYTLWPRPNYQHCTDPEDTVQLTDGKRTTDYFWTQQGTVGWTNAPYAIVTVDLGKIEPIAGVAMTTAAGVAGVTWPASVRILTSEDGKTYRDAGDLVAMDRKRAGPWPQGYAIRRLASAEGDLATRARFVQFVIIPPAGGSYIFTDEVEVLRGPDELLQREPQGQPVSSPAELFVQWRMRSSIEHRFETDVENVAKAIRSATLPEESAREKLLHRLAEVRKSLTTDAVQVGPSFRAVLPLTEAHARLFGVQAELWRAMGRPKMCACTASTWDPLDPFAPPPEAVDNKPIEVHAMRGESRAAGINVFWTGDQAEDVRVRFEGLLGSPAPGYITVHEVAWTDTGRGVPVAAALPEALHEAGAWKVRTVPGLVRQVWFTFRPTDLLPGVHEGAVLLSAGEGAPVRIPVHFRVYPMAFPKQTTLWLGGWDYSNGSGGYGITPENRQEFLRHLQERFVNAPWAGASVLMNFKWDPGDSAKIELDTREFDQWTADWPSARAYLVFLAMGDYSHTSKPRFGGAELGTPEFDRRVGAWISAWVKHLKSKGLSPGQLGLLIHDEPHEGSDITTLLAFARAVRAAEPEVLIWEDPTYHEPWKAPSELFEVCHVLCPNRPMWLAGGKRFEEFYLRQREQGKVLHSYSCSGPARLLDPYSYYRLQAWHCWRYGGTGSFFWAFGDNGGASSWNEYLVRSGPYTPLFLDEKTVTAGKQMEAVRESVEDYETLLMLRQSVAKAKAAGRNDAAVAAAESLLQSAAPEVLDAEGAGGLQWHDPKDRTLADRVRVKVLEAILSLQ